LHLSYVDHSYRGWRSGERGLEPPISRANYTSDADSAVLEDESGRVVLAPGRWHPMNHGGFHKRKSGNRSHAPEEDGCYTVPLSRVIDTLVTGVVVAIRGTILESGELAVNDICVPGLYVPSASVRRRLSNEFGRRSVQKCIFAGRIAKGTS
jgi:hypothetical protein